MNISMNKTLNTIIRITVSSFLVAVLTTLFMYLTNNFEKRKEQPQTITLPNGNRLKLINLNGKSYYYYEDYRKLILVEK